MKDNFIETINLTKVYDLKGKKNQIKALNNINISIKEGEIFGLLGPNGAGKTTLVSILTTLLQPTSGDAYIDGINIIKNPKNAKSRISLMLDSQMLYARITAFENLRFFCTIYRVPNYEEKINKMVNEIEEQIRKRGKKEIKAAEIGEMVMKKIKKIDNVAYIRFASVYRDFQDINDFKQEIKKL